MVTISNALRISFNSFSVIAYLLAGLIFCSSFFAGQLAQAQAPQEATVPVPRQAPERKTVTDENADRNATETTANKRDEKPKTIAPPKPLAAFIEMPNCVELINLLDIDYEITDPVIGENGCGFKKVFNVRSISGVKVSPATKLRCETVLQLARWVDDEVLPAAKAMSNQQISRGGKSIKLNEINQVSTYVCRRRNNQPDGKLSEHAIGAAIDIGMFKFEGRAPVSIQPAKDRKRDYMAIAFQRAVRSGSCLHFTTVLGPGSDGFHQDHLHLDIAQRKGGYRLCR